MTFPPPLPLLGEPSFLSVGLDQTNLPSRRRRQALAEVEQLL